MQKVTSMQNNQYIISGISAGKFICGTKHVKGTRFKSYNTNIAFIEEKGKVFLDEQSWIIPRRQANTEINFSMTQQKKLSRKLKTKSIPLLR